MGSTGIEDTQIFDAKEVAAGVGAAYQTVVRWVRDGRLGCIREEGVSPKPYRFTLRHLRAAFLPVLGGEVLVKGPGGWYQGWVEKIGGDYVSVRKRTGAIVVAKTRPWLTG